MEEIFIRMGKLFGGNGSFEKNLKNLNFMKIEVNLLRNYSEKLLGIMKVF